MLTTAGRDAALGALTGYAGLITAITDFRAGTVTEASYTGYGTRPSITFGSPANTSPTGGRQKANTNTVTFPINSGTSQDVIAWGLWSAATAGTLLGIGFLDTDSPIVGVGNVDDTIDAYAHGLSTDQRVFVLAAPGAPIPTGLNENVAYYVLASGLTADVFKLSTSSGGSAANITVGGASLFMPYTTRTITAGLTPSFIAGALVLAL